MLTTLVFLFTLFSYSYASQESLSCFDYKLLNFNPEMMESESIREFLNSLNAEFIKCSDTEFKREYESFYQKHYLDNPKKLRWNPLSRDGSPAPFLNIYLSPEEDELLNALVGKRLKPQLLKQLKMSKCKTAKCIIKETYNFSDGEIDEAYLRLARIYKEFGIAMTLKDYWVYDARSFAGQRVPWSLRSMRFVETELSRYPSKFHHVKSAKYMILNDVFRGSKRKTAACASRDFTVFNGSLRLKSGFQAYRKSSIRLNMIHEMAHHLDFTHRESNPGYYNEKTKEFEKTCIVSEYGKTNSYEYFAEAIEYYYLYGYQTFKETPGCEKLGEFLKKEIFEGGENPYFSFSNKTGCLYCYLKNYLKNLYSSITKGQYNCRQRSQLATTILKQSKKKN